MINVTTTTNNISSVLSGNKNFFMIMFKIKNVSTDNNTKIIIFIKQISTLISFFTSYKLISKHIEEVINKLKLYP